MLEILRTLAHIFKEEGKQLYLVGGTVRNSLLGKEESPDADLTTDARPDEIKRLAQKTNPFAIVLVGERFGTVRLEYETEGDQASESHKRDIIEITTFRSDQYSADSRKPEVYFGNNLEDDLLRRDFTINAMARDPLSTEIIDPFGGQKDLVANLIRAVGDDPDKRFDEDPLRLMRAARFAAQLDFDIEQKTAEAIQRQASTLGKISRERIRDEMTKTLLAPQAAKGLRLLVDLGLMPYIIPEILPLQGTSQKPAHSKDVYEHTLRVVENAPRREYIRWAALLHDIAKPRTKTYENGKVHFFGHEDLGAKMAHDIMRGLHFGREATDHVSNLVKLHMRSNAYITEWTDGAVRRLVLDAGDGIEDLIDLSRSDITSYRPEKVSRAVARITEFRERVHKILEEAQQKPLKSPIDGNDLMKIFNRPPGPWLRPVKEHLLGLVIDGLLEPEDVQGAIEAAKQFIEQESLEPRA